MENIKKQKARICTHCWCAFDTKIWWNRFTNEYFCTECYEKKNGTTDRNIIKGLDSIIKGLESKKQEDSTYICPSCKKQIGEYVYGNLLTNICYCESCGQKLSKGLNSWNK
jgi:hypothetical protein